MTAPTPGLGREPLGRRNAQPLAHHRHPVDRDVHDGARHLDRQCRAVEYRRRARDERRRGTWILTSYLVANAIILPISGWLSDVIGRKRFYMLSVGLFTVASLLCGLAPNLAAPGRGARAAGDRRRRHGAERTGDAGRFLSAVEAGAGFRRLRGRRHRRAGARARRLAATSPTMSPGTGSSSSTCRSARSRWRSSRFSSTSRRPWSGSG